MYKLINFFRNNQGKLERLQSLQDSLLQLQAEKDLLADNYQLIIKAVNCEDFSCKEEIDNNPLVGSGYIKSMAEIKLQERKLDKEITFLKSLESVSKALNLENKTKAVDVIKSLYKQGKLPLEVYNEAISSKTDKGQTKYADVMVLNTKGELLLLKRSIWEDEHKGAWVIPGGHVDEGEDDTTAAERELYEESGISVSKLKSNDQLGVIGWSKVGVYEDDKAHICYYMLSGVDTRDFEILLDEAETRDYLWVKREEIDNYPMVFNMADNVKHLLGWDETPNVTIIKKAILDGTIPLDKVADIVKAMNHKYIRKEPDGKGGFTYIYEEKKDRVDKSGKFVYVDKENTEDISKQSEKPIIHNRISDLPKGKIFDDAKSISGVFNKSSRTWSQVIEEFEKNKDNGIIKEIPIGDIHITQPNIQESKINKMLKDVDNLPIIDAVQFEDGEICIFDGHHRLLINWANNKDRVKVNLVKVKSENTENLKGGKADGRSTEEIADHHKVSNGDIQDEYSMGIKIEMEHTDDPKVAAEIVKDHLWEIPDYYTRLKKMEKESKEDIHKSYLQGDITDDEYEQGIEKAKKIKAKGKLKKIKKLINYNGKMFLRTYWVNDEGVEDLDKEVNEDVIGGAYVDNKPILDIAKLSFQTTDKVKVKTKIKETEGELVDITYDKQSQDWYLLVNNGEKVVWCKFNAIQSVTKIEQEEVRISSDYQFVKELGGSTGAKLVEKDGQYFVAKKGASVDHIFNEYEALKVYDELGVSVPAVEYFDYDTNTLYNQYIDGNLLSNLPLNQEVIDHVAKNFVVDCVMGNWDVVGMGLDNMILSNDDSKMYRIDVGGSLAYRAQGAKKESLQWSEKVSEIDSLRDPNVNPNAAKFFGHLTDQDIYDQLMNIKDVETINETVNKRIAWLVEEMDKRLGKVSTKSNPLTVYDEPLFKIDKSFGKDILGVYDKINEIMKITQEDIDFIKSNSSGFDSLVVRSVDEEKAKKYVDDYLNSESVKKLLAIGLTNSEIATINAYTGGDYGSFNTALVEFSNSVMGNVSFDNFKMSSIGLDEELDPVHGNLIVDSFYEAIIPAAKTVNFHHSSGDTDYNQPKIDQFNAKFKELNSLMSKSNTSLSSADKKHLEHLYDKYQELGKVLGMVNKNMSIVEKLKIAEKAPVKPVAKSKKGLDLNTDKLDIFRKGFFIASKVLLKGLTKMEKSGDPEFSKMGQTIRRVNISDSNKSDFIKQHQFGNFVIHQRASSSTKKEYANWSGNVELTILGGIGADVSSISQHKGEQEVLHRPFSLFYCGSVSNQNGIEKILMAKYA